MGEESSSTERSQNIWAPWRMEYIESLADGGNECFLCNYGDDPASDEKNLVLWRRKRSFALLNRFPYTGGHSMVAPLEHVADLDKLDDETMLEIFRLLRDIQRILAHALRAQGFNVGMNIGRCAGAGLPGHLHIHVVPRWSGDTNFMSVMGGTRIISQSLEALYAQLKRAGEEISMPESAP